jgi:hypothetical protein
MAEKAIGLDWPWLPDEGKTSKSGENEKYERKD